MAMEINIHEKTKRASSKKRIHLRTLYRGCSIGLLALTLVGCGSLKKAAIVGSAAGLGATAGSVISGGVIAPIAASATSASVASVVADQVVEQPTPTQPLEITGDATIVQEAPSNFFSAILCFLSTLRIDRQVSFQMYDNLEFHKVHLWFAFYQLSPVESPSQESLNKSLQLLYS